MKKLIIFDLDGTLLDTSPGIMHCYSETGKKLGLKSNVLDNKRCVIGGPLKDGFKKLYSIKNETQVDAAVDEYKKLYATQGIKMYKPYDGIEKMLKNLQNHGFYTAVATLKLEDYVKEMLKEAGLSHYFDIIKGWNGNDNCTKAVFLEEILSELSIRRRDTILVGDSIYDAKGTEEANVDFVGVSYGFGINPGQEQGRAIYTAESPEELEKFLTAKT